MASIPIGLSLQNNVISAEREKEIIAWLDKRPWSTNISRRTQHFGYEYNYQGKDILPGPPLEGPILELADMLENAGIMKPEQCIVNEYYRNQGIAPHIDSHAFGPVIVSISLNAEASMIFDNGTYKHEYLIPQRSVLMMRDEARYKWKHGISKNVTYDNGTKTKPADYRRISLTYRTIERK